MSRTTIWLTVTGVVLGALAGWYYWSQWGCTTGCTITGSPVNSALYGGVMGGLLLNTFKKEKKPKHPASLGNNKNNNN